jgi:preprotein translocase subunit YajC
VEALTLRPRGAGDNRTRLFLGSAVHGRSISLLRGFFMEFVIVSAAAGGAGGSAFFVQLFPLLLIFVVFYLFLIRPQQKRAKAHEAKIAAVQKNDEVVTAGGLMGKVTKVADEYIEVEIAPNVRVKAVKSTIANVQPRNAKAAND